jgi:hypothetical protein
MKARVIIENGITQIELSPENKYEETMLENTYDSDSMIITKVQKKYISYNWEYSINMKIRLKEDE